jgi:FkbM family methyltransferase
MPVPSEVEVAHEVCCGSIFGPSRLAVRADLSRSSPDALASMTDKAQLSDRLAHVARLRQASRPRRACSLGWRLAAIMAARKTGRQIPVNALTFWGDRMRVLLPEPLSCELYGYRFFEEGLSAFMLAEVRPGQRVFDVGAHYGYFTRLASMLVGPHGTVHSFEPTPSTFSMLARNTSDLANVTRTQAAAWHSRGTLSLKDFGPCMSMFNSLMAPRLSDSNGHASVAIEVEALSLDEYAERCGPPDFIKIDAESAEWSILQGMATMLARHRPKVTVEVGDFDVEGAARSRQLLDHVLGYGYTPFDYRDGRIQPHTLRSVYGYDNIMLIAS